MADFATHTIVTVNGKAYGPFRKTSTAEAFALRSGGKISTMESYDSWDLANPAKPKVKAKATA